MELKKGLVVKMRVYLPIRGEVAGNEIVKRADGSILNKNQSIKLMYDTLEWHNYLKQVKGAGWFKAVIESVHAPKKEGGWELIKTPQVITDEVAKALKGMEKPLTADQKRLKELEAKFDKMESKTGAVEVDSDLEDENKDLKTELNSKDEEIAILRAQLEGSGVEDAPKAAPKKKATPKKKTVAKKK